MKELVLLAQFRQPGEATMVSAFLESRGVHCSFLDSIIDSVWGSGIQESRIRLFVDKVHFKEALTLMKEGGFEDFVTEE